jgi:hypothetical protein
MTSKPKPVRRTKTPPRRGAAKSVGKSVGKSSAAKSAAKPAAKPAAKSARKSTSKPDAIDALIAASAATLALPIDPAWHANVKFHLALTLAHAGRVDEFPLPDEIEAAPVFHA